MRRVRKAGSYVLNLPLYWLTRVTPRRPRRWVFGAWLGTVFADNPRYLLEHVVAHHRGIEAVWIAHSGDAVAAARSAGYRAFRSGSVRGYWYTATAGLAVVSGTTWDVNPYVRPPRVLNLWHGIPLKHIEHDSPAVAARLRRRRRAAAIFPFHADGRYSAVIASSGLEAQILSSAFRLPASRVHVTGAPRNDLLTHDDGARPMRRILYAPTFRDHDDQRSVALVGRHSAAIEEFLRTHDLELHVRLHANSSRPPEAAGSRILWSSELATSTDVAAVLAASDVVITDYSSIYLDFLLTGRPIVFLPHDRESYLTRERGFYFDYDDDLVTPGPKCADWPSVLAALAALVEGQDEFARVRALCAERFHRHRDGAGCARVLDLALALAESGRVP